MEQNDGETMTTFFWGNDEDPVVMVWDGMIPEEQVIAKKTIREDKD